jgi:hypothetical protein
VKERVASHLNIINIQYNFNNILVFVFFPLVIVKYVEGGLTLHLTLHSFFFNILLFFLVFYTISYYIVVYIYINEVIIRKVEGGQWRHVYFCFEIRLFIIILFILYNIGRSFLIPPLSTPPLPYRPSCNLLKHLNIYSVFF